MTAARPTLGRVILGECLTQGLRPARFVFRDPVGKVRYHVEQSSPFTPLSYTKFRAVMALELAFADGVGRTCWRLIRSPGWWKNPWELRDLVGRKLWSFVPGSFWATSWTLTNAQTGEIAVAQVANPLILGPQRAEITSMHNQTLARLRWSNYSLWLGCHSQVRIELAEDPWEAAALALTVIRWAAMQQR
ncbi:MAG: hypothetical protein ACK42L_07260 [Thermoanaerobaculum sp.]